MCACKMSWRKYMYVGKMSWIEYIFIYIYVNMCKRWWIEYIYIYIYIYIYRERERERGGDMMSNCQHFKWLILLMHFIFFRFCLLCRKLESVRHCLFGNQHHEAIHSSRNLETCWKSQSKDFAVFACQSKDRFIFILRKTKHCPHHGCHLKWWHYTSIHLPTGP